MKSLVRSYSKTLICFVKNDFNMVHAADKLFIHRGTLIYRLNKIRELTKVSWDGWKDKMYLACRQSCL